MTPRWQIVLDFIKAYTKKHGVSPSYEVMTQAMGLRSRANLHRIVKRLEKDGYVQTKPYKFYSIKVVDKSVQDVVKL